MKKLLYGIALSFWASTAFAGTMTLSKGSGTMVTARSTGKMVIISTTPKGIFGCDNFTDTTGTLLTAHTATPCGGRWTLQTGSSGNGEVNNNVLEDQNGNAPFLYYPVDPWTEEYDVQSELFTSAGGGGPAGRMSTTAATSYSVGWSGGAAEWRLFQNIAGVATTLGTSSLDSPVGSTRTIRLEIRNATKRVFIGGTQRISNTTNRITIRGKAGWGGSGVTTDDNDNWVATNP